MNVITPTFSTRQTDSVSKPLVTPNTQQNKDEYKIKPNSVSLSPQGMDLAYQRQSNAAEGKKMASNASADTYQFPPKEVAAVNSASSFSPKKSDVTQVINGTSVVVSGHKYDTSRPGVIKIANVDEQINIDPSKLLNYSQNITMATFVSSPLDTPWRPLESMSFDNMYDLTLDTDRQTYKKAEDLAEILKTEQLMREQYGNEVKLTFDPNTENYIMLKPEDNFYDQTLTGEEVLNHFKESLFKSGKSPSAFAEIFESRGIKW